MTLNQAVSKNAHLTEKDLTGYVIHATKEVFSTMVMMDLEDSYPLNEPVTKFHCSITSMVGLAGTYTGILAIHCPQQLAMLRAFLSGRSPADRREHASVQVGACAACHLSHDANWPQVGGSRGHLVHVEQRKIASSSRPSPL